MFEGTGWDVKVVHMKTCEMLSPAKTGVGEPMRASGLIQLTALTAM